MITVAQLSLLLDFTRLDEQHQADAEFTQELAAALPSPLFTPTEFEHAGTQFAANITLRVSTVMLSLLVSAAPRLAARFRDSGPTGGTEAKQSLHAALVDPGARIADSSENMVVACVDNITRPIFEELGNATIKDPTPFQTQVTRNVKGSTAQSPPDNKQRSTATPVQGDKRLDMYVVASQQLVFFGEEESSTSEAHAEAQLSSSERIVFSAASFGTMPFIVVYVCRGPIFRFYLFSRVNVHEDRPQVKPIWQVFDLRQAADRLKVLFHLIFVYKWLRAAMPLHFPTRAMPVDKNVRVVLGAVKKEVAAVSDARKQQLEVFHVALDDAPECLARASLSAPTMAGTKTLLANATCCITMTPVGCHSDPTTAEEAKSAFIDILTALKWLHEVALWVHCDLRWPNVVRRCVVAGNDRIKGGWLLIDYEMSQPISNASWPTDLKDEFQPPGHKALWGPGDDLWQFFHLIVAPLTLAANDKLRLFCTCVRGFEGAASASQVLDHLHGLALSP